MLTPKDDSIILSSVYSSLAQLVEHAAVNRRVVGSSPTGGARKKHLYKASAFFNEICRCATREMAAPWKAPAVREISASRMLKGKFHITESAALYFTICDKQIISHWAKAKYFTIKTWMCVIDKMIFCIYMNAKANKQHRKRYHGWTRKPQRFRVFHADFLGGIQKISFPQLFTHVLGEKSIFWF